MKTLDAFTRAYLACALWSSDDESTEQGGEPFDRNYSIADIAPAAIDAAIADCAAFRVAAGSLLDDWPDESAGHDFWLTRNHHGAGFWDRGDLLPNSDALTAIVGWGTAFPEIAPYLGDNGLIYGFGEVTS